ncbi:MAG: hypothetical protein US75_C0017G0018 [Candidatus Woesebacteria bacterium GW2011_GWC1_38_13]|uniref:HTH cro/C1-type domain-containing protein n=2 Tax=Candidatus Woeseibacteriota TaxID=1752722 RepID=A0A0G0L7W0_9BACT|nr:MAG: hypothetical protein US75_C0017G0018 [Candidatus Woesebacteria bacterium GW2011_GWC1_38_13]KKQ83960.1 MAG: hypothetical protein UT06_C0012G0025 [Candidatus Woesebacteria bacterium GW2011_GWA1_38_8]
MTTERSQFECGGDDFEISLKDLLDSQTRAKNRGLDIPMLDEPSPMQKIGAYINAVRKKRGFTITKMAEDINVERPAVVDIELGNIVFTEFLPHLGKINNTLSPNDNSVTKKIVQIIWDVFDSDE